MGGFRGGLAPEDRLAFSMKKILQEIYDWLRLKWPFAKVINFFIGRERAFRLRAAEACRHALNDLPKAKDGGYIVAAGIFAGMKWPNQTLVGSEFAPKILGTYELELQETFRSTIVNPEISAFVDIGAAEGYYAVGAAILRPELPVFAYEIQRQAHAGIQDLAAANGVLSSLRVREIFSTELADRSEFGASPFVLVDIEGEEANLVDESFVSLFRKAVILIEIHDFLRPGTGNNLSRLLVESHFVKKIAYQSGIRRNCRPASNLSALDWKFATDEKRVRGLNYWLLALPKV